jgi:hypothetical protein
VGTLVIHDIPANLLRLMASPGHGRTTSLGRYSGARSATSRPTVHDMPDAAMADTVSTLAELSLLEWGAPLFHMSVR